MTADDSSAQPGWIVIVVPDSVSASIDRDEPRRLAMSGAVPSVVTQARA